MSHCRATPETETPMSSLRQACTLRSNQIIVLHIRHTWSGETPAAKKVAVNLELQLTAFTGYSMSQACTLCILSNPICCMQGAH